MQSLDSVAAAGAAFMAAAMKAVAQAPLTRAEFKPIPSGRRFYNVERPRQKPTVLRNGHGLLPQKVVAKAVRDIKAESPEGLRAVVLKRVGYSEEAMVRVVRRVERFYESTTDGYTRRQPRHIREKRILVNFLDRAVAQAFPA